MKIKNRLRYLVKKVINDILKILTLKKSRKTGFCLLSIIFIKIIFNNYVFKLKLKILFKNELKI